VDIRVCVCVSLAGHGGQRGDVRGPPSCNNVFTILFRVSALRALRAWRNKVAGENCA
jgi:hypothetical protein